LHSAIPENLSEREEATIYLNRTYGIRFTNLISKQALKGDDIFGSEYGFSDNSNIFSKIKNNILNFLSKKKESDTYQDLSPISHDSYPIIDFSKIKNKILKLFSKKKEPSIKYISNESFGNLNDDVSTSSLKDIDTNLSGDNINYVNELIKSSFTVPSVYEFSKFTIVFDIIND